MKILILVESLKIGGGSERFAATIGSKLFDEGYNVSYLTLMDEKPKFKFKGDYYTLSIDDIYTNSIKRLVDLLRFSGKIKRICEELEIDTILAVSEVANFYAVTSRLLYKNNPRIIATQHMNPWIFLDDFLKYRSIKFLYPHADEVVCVSRSIEKALNESYHVKNTRTIYNMMDTQKNIELSQEKIPINYKQLFEGENFNFISMGRLTRQKGHWFLIRSFRRVVDKYPNVRLFILGDGPLKKDFKNLIFKLELDDHVFLLGEQENVFPFLQNCDCFVFPSLWEGFGLVLIESLSLNLPVISTDCKSGPREVLCPELDFQKEIKYPYFGKYAILNQPFPNEFNFKNLKEIALNESEKMLAELMIKMVEDPSLRKEYSNGQIRAEIFDKKKIVDQWNKLLKRQ